MASPNRRNRKRVDLKPEREAYLVKRIRFILDKFPDEKTRRDRFSRSCGTVSERLTILDTHKFDVDENIIMNWN